MNIKEIKETRECLYKVIFSSLFLKEENSEINSSTMWSIVNNTLEVVPEGIEEIFEEEQISQEGKELINQYLMCYCQNYNEFSSLIEKNLKEGFTLSRLSKADLAIIYLALTELKANKQLSEKIIINEAVEISKKFGSENAYKFVNGILRNLVKEIRNE